MRFTVEVPDEVGVKLIRAAERKNTRVGPLVAGLALHHLTTCLNVDASAPIPPHVPTRKSPSKLDPHHDTIRTMTAEGYTAQQIIDRIGVGTVNSINILRRNLGIGPGKGGSTVTRAARMAAVRAAKTPEQIHAPRPDSVRWSAERDDALRQMTAAGMTGAQIGERFGLTSSAVNKRQRALGIQQPRGRRPHRSAA